MGNVLFLNCLELLTWLGANLRLAMKEFQVVLLKIKDGLARAQIVLGGDLETSLGLMVARANGQPARLIASFRPWREALVRGKIYRLGLLMEVVRSVRKMPCGCPDLSEIAMSSCVATACLQNSDEAVFEAGLLISGPNPISGVLPVERRRMSLSGQLNELPGETILKRELHFFDSDGEMPSLPQLRVLLAEAANELFVQSSAPIDLYVEAREGEELRRLQALGFSVLCRFMGARKTSAESGSTALLHLCWDHVERTLSKPMWLNERGIPDLVANRRHRAFHVSH